MTEQTSRGRGRRARSASHAPPDRGGNYHDLTNPSPPMDVISIDEITAMHHAAPLRRAEMNQHATPTLHRDDPDKDPLVGHVKVTRQDWLNMARNVLVTHGVGGVKILGLAKRMAVSRSSFYWYFKDRSGLLSALLDEWEERNTAQIVSYCAMPSQTITEALCNFFICFVDPSKFDSGLDFAVREWSRREGAVRQRVDAADERRIRAVIAMFTGHDYPASETDARARILYFMQLGYHALEVHEDIATRMARVPAYIEGFTGRAADKAALERFQAQVAALQIV